MSDEKSIGKTKAGVCTSYSPGGYKKPVKPEPEKDRETNEGTVDWPVTAKPSAFAAELYREEIKLSLRHG